LGQTERRRDRDVAECRVLLERHALANRGMPFSHDTNQSLLDEVLASQSGGDRVFATELQIGVTVLERVLPVRLKVVEAHEHARRLPNQERGKPRKEIELQVVRAEDAEAALARPRVERSLLGEDALEMGDGSVDRLDELRPTLGQNERTPGLHEQRV